MNCRFSPPICSVGRIVIGIHLDPDEVLWLVSIGVCSSVERLPRRVASGGIPAVTDFG